MQISSRESHQILKGARVCRHGDCPAAKVGEPDAEHVQQGVQLADDGEQALDPGALPNAGGLCVALQHPGRSPTTVDAGDVAGALPRVLHASLPHRLSYHPQSTGSPGFHRKVQVLPV